MAWSVKTMAMAESTCALLPGLPQELALLCFSKLPIDAVARCRAVSRSWASALLQYPPPFRLPQALACFCAGRVNASRESSMAWLLFFRSDLQCRVVPFYDKRTAHTKGMHIYSSYMQVIPTGTNLLLVQSKLTLTGEPNIGIADANPCVDHGHTEPGLLQAFDLWQMQWCKEASYGAMVSPMHVNRWCFATAHLGEYVYVAGGSGDHASGRSAERLNVKTWQWEMLPEMIRERCTYPVGFAMGGRFYVVGGEPKPTTTDTTSGEFYDPEKGAWELVPGMWPIKMRGVGEEQHVVVVKDEAYAIAERSDVLRWQAKGGWEKAGRVPDLYPYDWVEPWLFRLVSVGEDELWVALVNKDGDFPWLVFSCKPHLSNDIYWQHLPFTMPCDPPQRIVFSTSICI